MISVVCRAAKQILVLLTVFLVSLSSANADVIFSDNFDADTRGTPVSSLLNWTIDSPSIDVVGSGGTYAHLCNGDTAGNCLDMDGSPGNGQITTKDGLNLAAGEYTFSFDYGNNTNSNNSLAWNIGSLIDGIIYTDSSFNNTYTHFSTTFTLSTAASGVFITFAGGGTEDLGGTVLDNVLLASVPEPSMLMLLCLGLLGLSKQRIKSYT